MVVVTLDTETTGLIEDPKSRAVEIGAVRHNLETGEILGTFESLICPRVDLLDDHKFELCKRISGIHKDQILDAPEYKQVMGDFVRWVDDDLLYAWNLPFDQRQVQRLIMDVTSFGGNQLFWIQQAEDWNNHLHWAGCWQHLYTYMHPERAGTWEKGNLKRISMARTMMYEGWSGEQTHRALDDAKLAAQAGHIIFHKLKE